MGLDKLMGLKLRSLISPSKELKAGSVDTSGVLIGLMVSTMAMAFNLGMFGVAVPLIRDEFGIPADMAAWVVTIYTLPFMIFMPLYGRLADAFGKKNLFISGIVIFMIGTMIALVAPSLNWLMFGRAVQGLGTAGINPLCIAIISQFFAPAERGKTMGTWNSVIPFTNMIGPIFGGLLIDHIGWRAIYGPILAGGLIALIVAYRKIPAIPGTAATNSGFLRHFDWGGVILLAATLSSLLFYASSRPITGVEPLQDWRLLAAALLFSSAFIYWEKRRANPFLDLTIFRHRVFSFASLGSGIRMFSMSGINFLMPLYLVDLYGLSAAASGLMLMLHAGALLLTIRLGGQLADRLGSRWPVVFSMAIQSGVMIYLALLPASSAIWWVGVGIASHGLGAGLSLAALHRAAMADIAENQTGVAAGLYSMIRFGGSVFGTALGGVILQMGLDRALLPAAAYQTVFWFVAGVALLGTFMGLGLRE